ncbi:MAG TPA: alpha-ketoglutarate-dependent dioxygenase AlkB [Thermopetrobacter sp.]|nr:alpha-ketoglutarate-dependent dioxygenase AlkB [Thermopetrobacter sp.]
MERRKNAAATPPGLRLYRGLLGVTEQARLLEEIAAIVRAAPLFTPRMPNTGRPFSVRMSNCGALGWVSDREGGYRYQPRHPRTGRPWPPMPQMLRRLWGELTGYPAPPEAALINHYPPGARMGLHVDADEQARDAPVLSISLGDAATFRIGGPRRRDPTASVRLHGGDVLLLGGAARHCHHGIDRIHPGTAAVPLPEEIGPGRLNITLRRVTPPAQ